MKRIVVIKKVNCAPCAVLTRLLPGLQEKYSNAEWHILEVNSAEELEQYGYVIKSFPTTLLYDEIGNYIGAQPGAIGVDQFLAKHLT